ncbi:hypothetical protein HRI_000229400 [Hibiscus trionum]|uniref:Uncharacterized protein n=1 Tax=Hibiscus trionum TaxID=183268 RepID=A0A9W7LIL3_HIBTR|nr:hypothetical protein HRI_000229400 [Hibiscus trionum]
MGKLNSSLILPCFVSGGKNAYNFRSTLSFSPNTIATRIEALRKNSMHVKGNPTRHNRFLSVDDALALFDEMVEKYPMPSIVEFTKLLAPIVRMKHYVVVVSMCSQMELFGVSPDVFFFQHLD